MTRFSYFIFRNSLQYGIQCLKILNYSKNDLEKMRSKSEADLSDVFVWTNTRVIKWVNSIGTFFFSKMTVIFLNGLAYLEIKA